MAVLSKGGTPVLGLDIGAAFIKAVEMRPGKGALAITGVGVLPTPSGCIVNDEIVDPIVLAQAVKQLLAESGIKTKNVVTSVAGQSSVVVRVIEVPRMTDKELAETMRWEIDRHIPFSPDEVTKDFSPIVRPNDDPSSANMSVLLAVAQNNLISGMMETVLAAGLTPVAIDVEMLSGARAVFDIDDAHLQETVAIVNLGATKTDVAIFEGGSLSFPRTIPVAGNAMTDAVAAALGVDAADAELLKKQYGAVPADATERYGSHAPATADETFSFGDFGGDTYDFEAAPGAPEPGSAGFAATTEGPVFDTPFSTGAEGPTFGEPTITGPTPGEPDVLAEPYQPTFDVPAFEQSTFGQPAEGPSFDMPEVGPANTGPVTPSFTTPLEAVELTPEEAPLRPASVPEVISEGDRHRSEISNAFMPVVSELAQEIRRSLEYYSTRANNATVHRVLLFGGSANLPGLANFMQTELGVPVEIVGLPRAISLANNALSADYLDQLATMLPVAMGLAARGSIVTEPVAAPSAA